jgi:hypothetical protein
MITHLEEDLRVASLYLVFVFFIMGLFESVDGVEIFEVIGL